MDGFKADGESVLESLDDNPQDGQLHFAALTERESAPVDDQDYSFLLYCHVI